MPRAKRATKRTTRRTKRTKRAEKITELLGQTWDRLPLHKRYGAEKWSGYVELIDQLVRHKKIGKPLPSIPMVEKFVLDELGMSVAAGTIRRHIARVEGGQSL